MYNASQMTGIRQDTKDLSQCETPKHFRSEMRCKYPNTRFYNYYFTIINETMAKLEFQNIKRHFDRMLIQFTLAILIFTLIFVPFSYSDSHTVNRLLPLHPLQNSSPDTAQTLSVNMRSVLFQFQTASV